MVFIYVNTMMKLI